MKRALAALGTLAVLAVGCGGSDESPPPGAENVPDWEALIQDHLGPDADVIEDESWLDNIGENGEVYYEATVRRDGRTQHLLVTFRDGRIVKVGPHPDWD